MFTQTNDTIVWQHVRRSRTELLAYLETLTTEQWNTQSLCSGWRVRDVVAHLILAYTYSAGSSWVDFVRSGFRVNIFMKQTAIALGNSPTAELLRRYKSTIDEQNKPSSVDSLNVLVDVLVHEQDIRIPLDNPKNMDIDSLKLVFAHWQPNEYNFGERITGLSKRLTGLGFTVTDLNITKGTGLQVVGSAQNILLAAAGRRVILSKLSGEGVALLRSR